MAWGLINQFVPPFKMVDGAPSTITQASVTAAVLAGAIEVFNIAQNPGPIEWGNAAMSLGAAMVASPGRSDRRLERSDHLGRVRRLPSPKTVLDKTINLGIPGTRFRS